MKEEKERQEEEHLLLELVQQKERETTAQLKLRIATELLTVCSLQSLSDVLSGEGRRKERKERKETKGGKGNSTKLSTWLGAESISLFCLNAATNQLVSTSTPASYSYHGGKSSMVRAIRKNNITTTSDGRCT